MLINFSNHPSSRWEDEQIQAAGRYGEVHDLPFPNVDPLATSNDIQALACRYAEQMLALSPTAVLCQGEFGLAFAVVNKLKQAGVLCIHACSKRDVVETQDESGCTTRVSVFRFVQFRAYE